MTKHGMKEWQWDELSCEITEMPNPVDKNGFYIEGTFDDGWRVADWNDRWLEERSDRNHLSLRTKAETKEEAHQNFWTHPEYRDHMEDDIEDDI